MVKCFYIDEVLIVLLFSHPSDQYGPAPSVVISFSCFNLLHCVPPLSSTALTPPIHHFWGQPTGLFPFGFHIEYLLGFLSSPILITCPYHLNLIHSISFNNGVTCNSVLMMMFLVLSFHLTPFIIPAVASPLLAITTLLL